MEILAPVGEINMLYAAVRAGANAVYLGLEQMNARKSAVNFTPHALKEAVAYCHARKVKVFVTLNTLIQSNEISSVPLIIKQIAQSGADAVIVQDLAVAALVKNIAPTLKLHASTQMSVHSVHGAKQLKKLGFSRVILARELPLETIAEISAQCDIETEIFVHGALCMCVSGQCYMSAFYGGRSGNKGSCAGPCRLPFSAINGADKCDNVNHLSLKDMSFIHMLKQIENAGVSCVKIEGRLRTPEYTAAAVNACLCALNGEEYDEQLLQDVFSRSGFTNSYINGALDGTMFGIRTSEDSEAQKRALPKLRELFRTERQSVEVCLKIAINGGGAQLIAIDEDGIFCRVTTKGQKPTAAQKDRSEDIKKSLMKAGGTPFYVNEDIEIEGAQWFLPSSVINNLRKEVLLKLLVARSAQKPHEVDEVAFESAQKMIRAQTAAKNASANTNEKQLFVQISDMRQLPEEWVCAESNEKTPSGFIVPLEQWQSVPSEIRCKTFLALPEFSALTAVEERTHKTVTEIFSMQNESKFAGCFVQNVAHIHMCEGIKMFGGFRLNVTNALSFESYGAMGLSMVTAGIEATCTDIDTLKQADEKTKTAAVVYGHMPLMLTYACPLHNVQTCKGCTGKGVLTDRKGEKLNVMCHAPGKSGARTIHNAVPLYMGDKAHTLDVDILIALFTTEDKTQVRDITMKIAEKEAFDGRYTRGLYFK